MYKRPYGAERLPSITIKNIFPGKLPYQASVSVEAQKWTQKKSFQIDASPSFLRIKYKSLKLGPSLQILVKTENTPYEKPSVRLSVHMLLY